MEDTHTHRVFHYREAETQAGLSADGPAGDVTQLWKRLFHLHRVRLRAKGTIGCFDLKPYGNPTLLPGIFFDLYGRSGSLLGGLNQRLDFVLDRGQGFRSCLKSKPAMVAFDCVSDTPSLKSLEIDQVLVYSSLI